MGALPRVLMIGPCLAALVVLPVAAQPSDSNVSLNAPGFLIKKPPPGLPDVKAQPLAWPRLDPGAVLCRSEADLDRLADRRRGEPVDEPIDCQIVRVPTAITILQRKGPGRAEVASSDSKAAGWTDAWLPERTPPPSRPAAR